MTPTQNLLSYSFYPGCSLHASAKEYEVSTKSLFRALRIGLREVPDWFCCGATPAHNVDELLSLSLCAKNLELANQVEGDLAVACAACFSRLKTAQHKLDVFPEKARQVEAGPRCPAGGEQAGQTSPRHPRPRLRSRPLRGGSAEAADRPQGRLLLRLSPHPAAGGPRPRRLRRSDDHGGSPPRRRRRAGGVDPSHGVLRRQLHPLAAGSGAQALRADPRLPPRPPAPTA